MSWAFGPQSSMLYWVWKDSEAEPAGSVSDRVMLLSTPSALPLHQVLDPAKGVTRSVVTCF